MFFFQQSDRVKKMLAYSKTAAEARQMFGEQHVEPVVVLKFTQ